MFASYVMFIVVVLFLLYNIVFECKYKLIGGDYTLPDY